MTTLVALATRDCVALGCDSLGSEIQRLVDPADLFEYFDQTQDYALKLDADGKPILKSFADVYGRSREVPVHHVTRVTKMCPLFPLKAGLMLTGISSLGSKTIASLVEEFTKTTARGLEAGNYTMADIADQLITFLRAPYIAEFPNENRRPFFEFILGGYGKMGLEPAIYRITFPKGEKKWEFETPGFGIVFGGQMKEIQRIAFGTDIANQLKIVERYVSLLRRYRDRIVESLTQQGIAADVPEPTSEQLTGQLDFFGDGWRLDGFEARWGEFSEQNAIECVDFFVDIMIRSQQFSTGMPTVGGDVHIGLITPRDGFRFISREEYAHRGHLVPKHRSTWDAKGET